ncbi:MAG: HNH endonuclease, partial [Chloroflexi bacterium]
MKRIICLLGLLAVFTIAFSGCGSITITLPAITPTSGSTGNTGSNTTGSEPHWGVQTKTSGCVAHDALPDSACTPGDVLATGTKDAICQSGYASSVRNVPVSEKNQVYAEYGIAHHSPGQYEVDHLVSLELGGSNDISNLWPEAASPKPGFHE